MSVEGKLFELASSSTGAREQTRPMLMKGEGEKGGERKEGGVDVEH